MTDLQQTDRPVGSEPTEFDSATAVTDQGGGRFAAELGAGWSVGGGINGGYLLAILGRAVSRAVPEKPDPFAVSAHYLSASTAGPAEVATEVVREGGSVATVRATLRQGGVARIDALATTGRLADLDDEVATTAVEFDLAPREKCVTGEMAPPEVRAMAPLLGRFDMRFDPDHVGWALGDPSGRGEMKAWFRLNDDHEPDPFVLLAALDALPPVTFDLGRPGWAPTLELTAHVRAMPAPGWLKVRHATRNLAGGMFEEDCEVWDSAGRLVAQSRQLARVPR